MNHLLRGLAVAAGLALAGTALAGPVNDFESAMRAAYADYRSALFLTNSNKAEQALQAIDGFTRQWSTLADAGAEAPPHYADDTGFRRTLDAVAETAAKARAEVESGALTKAHETLEGIREEIGQLHERNNIVGFSDRMNAYHAMMERILGTDYRPARREWRSCARTPPCSRTLPTTSRRILRPKLRTRLTHRCWRP